MTSPRGLLAPFRRDRKRDFASGDGEELLASKVLAVLATEGATARCSGELPWRTAFGTPLQLLRHRNNDIALGELARVYVRDALARWLPEVKLLAENMILRVAAKRMNDDSITFGMGFDQEREADEQVIVNGVELLIAKTSLPFIQGVTLDFVEMEPGDIRFIFIPPNSPQAS